MTHAWGRQPVGARLKDVGSGAEDESVGKFGAHKGRDEHHVVGLAELTGMTVTNTRQLD